MGDDWVNNHFWCFALRVWETLSLVTCCRSLVVVYGGCLILQIGVAAESPRVDGEAVAVDVTKLLQGSLCQGVMKSAARKYRHWDF